MIRLRSAGALRAARPTMQAAALRDCRCYRRLRRRYRSAPPDSTRFDETDDKARHAVVCSRPARARPREVRSARPGHKHRRFAAILSAPWHTFAGTADAAPAHVLHSLNELLRQW